MLNRKSIRVSPLTISSYHAVLKWLVGWSIFQSAENFLWQFNRLIIKVIYPIKVVDICFLEAIICLALSFYCKLNVFGILIDRWWDFLVWIKWLYWQIRKYMCFSQFCQILHGTVLTKHCIKQFSSSQINSATTNNCRLSCRLKKGREPEHS